MRLIDADALLNQFDPDSNERLHPIAIRMRIVQTPTITPTQQWIPVKERLPENGQIVMATMYTGNVALLRCDKRNVWYGANNFCEAPGVTAWMPLPEPYKAKMDGKDGDHDASK